MELYQESIIDLLKTLAPNPTGKPQNDKANELKIKEENTNLLMKENIVKVKRIRKEKIEKERKDKEIKEKKEKEKEIIIKNDEKQELVEKQRKMKLVQEKKEKTEEKIKQEQIRKENYEKDKKIESDLKNKSYSISSINNSFKEKAINKNIPSYYFYIHLLIFLQK